MCFFQEWMSVPFTVGGITILLLLEIHMWFFDYKLHCSSPGWPSLWGRGQAFPDHPIVFSPHSFCPKSISTSLSSEQLVECSHSKEWGPDQPCFTCVCELGPRWQWQRDGEGFVWLDKWLVAFTPIVQHLFSFSIISQNILPNSIAYNSIHPFFLFPLSQRLGLTGLGRTC